MQAGDPRIGLTLSGGGCRAIAFHLGCLRALKHLGLLDRVLVLSTVSGGSVIGACFHAHGGDFESFEAKVRAVLTKGLVGPMVRQLFSRVGLKVVGSFMLIGFFAVCTTLIKLLMSIVRRIVPRSLSLRFEAFE